MKLYEEIYGYYDHYQDEAPIEDCDPREYYMAIKALKILKEYSCEVLEMIESGKKLPEWAEAKIIESSAYMRDVKHCLEHGDGE